MKRGKETVASMTERRLEAEGSSRKLNFQVGGRSTYPLKELPVKAASHQQKLKMNDFRSSPPPYGSHFRSGIFRYHESASHNSHLMKSLAIVRPLLTPAELAFSCDVQAGQAKSSSERY